MGKKKKSAEDKARIEEAAEQVAHLMLRSIDEKAAKQKRKPRPKNKFTDEEIQQFVELGEVLRKIHARLMAEGKIKMVNGKIVFLDQITKQPKTKE